MTKIVRTICYFTEEPGHETVERLNNIEDRLESKGTMSRQREYAHLTKGSES